MTISFCRYLQQTKEFVASYIAKVKPQILQRILNFIKLTKANLEAASIITAWLLAKEEMMRCPENLQECGHYMIEPVVI